ncbi:hypothetical protein B0H14DRAFT_3862426, partial [Mycena olivaceomarginata]
MGPHKPEDRKGKLVEQSGAAAIAILEALEKSSSVFPPLQSVVCGTLHIAKLVQNFRSDKKKWTVFSQHIEKIVVDVIGKLSENDAVRRDIKESIEQLSVCLKMCQFCLSATGKTHSISFRSATTSNAWTQHLFSTTCSCLGLVVTIG